LCTPRYFPENSEAFRAFNGTRRVAPFRAVC
jgi:hypothetical protein